MRRLRLVHHDKPIGPSSQPRASHWRPTVQYEIDICALENFPGRPFTHPRYSTANIGTRSSIALPWLTPTADLRGELPLDLRSEVPRTSRFV